MSKKLPVLDALATFVDVGSEHMHVSVGGGAPEVFGTVTSQLHALRDRLLAQHVRSVAMEATGVYWLPLYGVLEAAGLQVRMVNGCQTRNLPGRKTDMVDCQWGATPHMHGLLRAGFVPPADIRRLQDYLRLRADHVGAAGGCVQLMQKALERMNIKLHGVIASLAGTSGLAVVRAVVAGERSPQALLSLCDVQIRRNKSQAVLEALRGTWAFEHVFALSQALQSWEHYQRLIAECDARIAAVLPAYYATQPPLAKTAKRAGVNAPRHRGVWRPRLTFRRFRSHSKRPSAAPGLRFANALTGFSPHCTRRTRILITRGTSPCLAKESGHAPEPVSTRVPCRGSRGSHRFARADCARAAGANAIDLARYRRRAAAAPRELGGGPGDRRRRPGLCH